MALDVAVFGTLLLFALPTLTVSSPVAYAFVIAMPVAALASTVVVKRFRADAVSVNGLPMRNFALALAASILLTVAFDQVASALGIHDNGLAFPLAVVSGFTIGLNVALLVERRHRSTSSTRPQPIRR